jgi:hypothetical protein
MERKNGNDKEKKMERRRGTSGAKEVCRGIRKYKGNMPSGLSGLA